MEYDCSRPIVRVTSEPVGVAVVCLRVKRKMETELQGSNHPISITRRPQALASVLPASAPAVLSSPNIHHRRVRVVRDEVPSPPPTVCSRLGCVGSKLLAIRAGVVEWGVRVSARVWRDGLLAARVRKQHHGRIRIVKDTHRGRRERQELCLRQWLDRVRLHRSVS